MTQISQSSVKYLCFGLSKGLRDPLHDTREALPEEQYLLLKGSYGYLGEWLGFVKFGFQILA